MEDICELKRIANRMRQSMVKMMSEARSPEAGDSLSTTELVAALFFHAMRHNPSSPTWPDRDRLFLSGAHGAAALFCAYVEAGYVDPDAKIVLPRAGAPVEVPSDRGLLPMLEASLAAGGNGLSLGLGAALNGRMEKRDYRAHVLVALEECREVRLWQTAKVAAQQRLDNLCAIVDFSVLEGNALEQVLSPAESLAALWQACGWETQVLNGHDFAQILEALARARQILGRPTCLVAITVLGKGVPFLEHGRRLLDAVPSAEQVCQALEELEKEAASIV